MKPWLAAALLLLLAVPFQTYWQDYEVARRGALALLVGALCLIPGVLPRRLPGSVWAISLLALWVLARSLSVANSGYALEASCHMLALAALVFLGTSMPMTSLLRASLPTGIVVALVGIAQGLGYLLFPDSTEAVSTLGNRNVASELLAVCGAAAGLLACVEDSTRRDRVLALVTLTLCSVAIAWNTSRSGLIALPLGCLPCLLLGRRWIVLGTLAVGLTVGAVTATTTVNTPVTSVVAEAPPSTIEVRKELWLGALAMINDRPVLGYGGGQFQVEYPPYRTTEEIELSSFGRRFQTAPKTVHNDYLQILIDLGLIGFVLAAVAAWLTMRRVPLGCTGPLMAFFVLAGVRSPLGNAPAAALVFLFAGTLLWRSHATGAREFTFAATRHRIQSVVLGLFLIWFGGGQLFSQMATTDYVRQMKIKTDWKEAIASVEQALFFRPHDHDMRIERLKDRLKQQSTLPAARTDLEYLLRIAPALPSVQIHKAEFLYAEGNPDAALKVLALVRSRDMENQRAIQVSVLILVRQRNAPAAILMLYRSKHPRTRENLANVLDGLAKEAKDPGDRALLLCEQAFVESLDRLETYFAEKSRRNEVQRLGDLLRLNKVVKRFGNLQRSVPRTHTDLRSMALLAVLSLEQGDRSVAETLAGPAQRHDLLPTHRAMMAKVITELLTIPAWRELLGSQ